MTDTRKGRPAPMADIPPATNDTQRLIRIETLLEQQITNDNDHETRIRRLERMLYIGIGAGAAFGSAVGSYIGNLPVTIGH